LRPKIIIVIEKRRGIRPEGRLSLPQENLRNADIGEPICASMSALAII
jgi:hypothetical protein